MIIKVGTVIESDFGTGPVVAITKEWLIHEDRKGAEYCLSRTEDSYWIPATGHEVGGGQGMEIELPGEAGQ